MWRLIQWLTSTHLCSENNSSSRSRVGSLRRIFLAAIKTPPWSVRVCCKEAIPHWLPTHLLSTEAPLRGNCFNWPGWILRNDTICQQKLQWRRGVFKKFSKQLDCVTQSEVKHELTWSKHQEVRCTFTQYLNVSMSWFSFILPEMCNYLHQTIWHRPVLLISLTEVSVIAPTLLHAGPLWTTKPWPVASDSPDPVQGKKQTNKQNKLALCHPQGLKDVLRTRHSIIPVHDPLFARQLVSSMLNSHFSHQYIIKL